ncbi:MAG: aminoacyl-tRNA hydrolase [Pseudomonadota bacterium]|nr:aminoacyl-tRNA hydrolase [Pseudomonadota bacterium]
MQQSRERPPRAKLIVGLGNPTPRYQFTRHNAGFLCLDLLATAIALHWKKGHHGLWGRGELEGSACIFLKPQTYMNESGVSVQAAASYYKIKPAAVVVIHDDLDVPSGKVKAKIGGNAGGHNGIKSIIKHLGTDAFHRIKMGVAKTDANIAGQSWVLSQFSSAELDILRTTMVEDVLVRLRQIFQQL